MDLLPRLILLPRLSDAVRTTLFAVTALLISLPAHAEQAVTSREPLPEVRVSTTEGAFTLRLRPDIAPRTVANFLQYVEEGYYDGTIFHRVIPGFMVQGGGFEPGMKRKPTRDPIVNESRQTAKNLRGTIAMARTSNPDSATAQFFINLVDNPHLDTTPARTGYTVFGSVTEGMSVLDAIAKVETTRRNGMANVPAHPVLVESVRRLDNEQ